MTQSRTRLDSSFLRYDPGTRRLAAVTAFGRSARSLMIALVFILVPLAPTIALGQSPAVEADRLIDEGVEHRRQGDDEAALGCFQQAHAILPTGRSHAQLGLVHQALGNWAEAYRHLSSALAQDEPWVEARRASVLEPALGTVRAQVALLEVRGGVDGASLWVNGVEVGSLPLDAPHPVPVGPLRIEVRAEGYLPVERLREATAGGTIRESITLIEVESSLPETEPGTSPPDTQPETAVGLPPHLPERIPAPPETELEWGPPSPAAWTMIGLGSATLLSGLFTYLRWNRFAHDWNDCKMDIGVAMDFDEGDCRRNRQIGINYRRATTILVPVGGVLSITGLILFFTTRNRQPVDASSGIRLSPGPGDLGLGLRLSL